MTSTRFIFALAIGLLATACGTNGPTNMSDAGDAVVSDGATSDSAAVHSLALAPGEVAELTLSAGAGSTQLSAPTGTEQFIVVLASMQLDGAGSSGTYQATTTAATALTESHVVNGCAFDSTMWASRSLPQQTPPSGASPAVGTTRMFTTTVRNVATVIPTHVVAVSDHTIVWADDSPAHPAQLDAAFVNQFLSDFDNVILPREHSIFGTESDIDNDGHVSVVFTPLTYQTAVAFFSACDLQSDSSCRASNHGEVLWLTPPNSIDPPYNTPNAIKEILAHELSHLIHFGHKVLANHLSTWDDGAYVIEGYGALAQDVIGYQAGNLYVTQAGLDQINDFSLGDVLVNGTVYDPSRDGTLRGGAYLFSRWIYDRAGGDMAQADMTITSRGGPALIRSLEDSPMSIADDLPIATGATIENIAMDFYTTLASSNRGDVGGHDPINPCFAYLPTVRDPVTTDQRGANMFAMFHGMMMNGPAVQPIASADGLILGGGVEFLEIDAVAGQTQIPLTIMSDPAVLPRVRIARVQ